MSITLHNPSLLRKLVAIHNPVTCLSIRSLKITCVRTRQNVIEIGYIINMYFSHIAIKRVCCEDIRRNIPESKSGGANSCRD